MGHGEKPDEQSMSQNDVAGDPLGAWFGNPHNKAQMVWMTFQSEEQLQQFRNVNTTRPKDAAKYALRLLTLFFSEEELAESNCTPAEGRKLLDQKTLSAIKRKCTCC